MIELRMMRWVEHVTRMGVTRNPIFLSKILKGKVHLGDGYEDGE
jgi:hypothetical protein